MPAESEKPPFKFHIPPLPPGLMVGELTNILIPGVVGNPRSVLVDNEENADYILLDFRHFEGGGYAVSKPERTIVVDYCDQQDRIYSHHSALYFKRSVVDRRSNRFVRYPRKVIPISYCVRPEYMGRRFCFPGNRSIDVAVFFVPRQVPEKARNHNRARVARFVREEFGDCNIHVGIVGRVGPRGRNTFQRRYFELMTNSRIVVTCNPDRWEGDYRLFEALGSGSLVLVDRMLTPLAHPFVDGEHLVYYDNDNLERLADSIREYLGDEERRRETALRGYEHAMQYHTPANRIDEIIDAIENIMEGGEKGDRSIY